MGINQGIFCPQNYILLGNSDAQKAHADVIISEMKTSLPEMFEGNKDSFSFELRYAAPFDKGFHELKRLQGTAAEAAGRRNEFKGYIIIDMNSWLTHHDEEYLNKALLFLIDMSECWNYIFLVDNQNTKAARELVCKVLSVFYRHNIPCTVKEGKAQASVKARINTICKTQGVMCSPPVKEFFQELLEQGFHDNIVAALVREMAWSAGKKLSMNSIADFMPNQESVIRYLLAQKEYNRFLTIVEKKKECWYGEKEAV